MKNSYKIFALILISIILLNCSKHNDNDYFNGNISFINSKMRKVKNVTLNQIVSLDGLNFGTIAVYDSLIIFWNPKLSDKFFNIFNLHTGKEMGSFCQKGQGPYEMVAVSPIHHLFEEENDLKTLLFAAFNSKLLKWNISQSIKHKTTVIDTIIDYSCSIENMGACYDYLFLKDENTLFARVPSIALNEEEASLPQYQKRSVYSDNTLESYTIYRKSIKNGDASIIPETFFNSVDAFKPDGSKIVQAMTSLQQLNILDTKTGEVNGYKVKGSTDFSIFKTKKKAILPCYVRIQADDKYIYASFWGNEAWDIKEIPAVNAIHIYDWKGNWIYELKTDKPVHEMWLDKTNNRLYTTNLNVDDVFYIDLNDIL